MFLIFVIVVIFLFLFFSSNPSTLANLAKLNTITNITSDKLDNPSSNRYYFEGWFFVDNNFPVDKENILFRRANDLIVSLKGTKLTLYANGSKATSNYVAATYVNGDNQIPSPVSDEDGKGFSLPITTAFPLQKWTYLVIHCDGDVVDVYLEGKMVASKRGNPIKFDKNDPVSLGNKHTDGRVALFNYVPDNITPQEVWSRYVYNSVTGASNSTYKISVDVLRNNSVKQTVNLI